MNGDAFELALALTRYGFRAAEVFGTIQAENFPYLRRLGEESPETRIYANTEPSMLYYDPADCPADIAVGKDAAWYHPESAHVMWNSDEQPFGYAGLRRLFEALSEAVEGKEARA